MEKLFKLKENGTNVRTEVTAGITIFMTMAYILAVNPGILADAGMDSGADDRRVLPALAVLLADFPDGAFICHHSRPHYRRVHDDAAGSEARLVRCDRSYTPWQQSGR